MPKPSDSLRTRKNHVLERFNQLSSLYAEAIDGIKSTFKDDHELPDILMMASIVWGEDAFHDKLLQMATKIDQLDALEEKELFSEIETLLVGLSGDLTKKEHFFNEIKNIKQAQEFRKKVKAYDGSKDIIKEMANIPEEFSKDAELNDLRNQYDALMADHYIPVAAAVTKLKVLDKAKHNVEQSKFSQGVAKLARKAINPLAKAMDSKHISQEEAKPGSELESFRASKEVLDREATPLVIAFQKRLQNLRVAHEKRMNLEAENDVLVKKYNQEEVRKLQEKCKAFFAPLVIEGRQIIARCFGTNNANQNVDLLAVYKAQSTAFEDENSIIRKRLTHLADYKKAKKDVKASQLNRDHIAKKFDNIQIQHKLHVQKNMFMAPQALADDIDQIIRGNGSGLRNFFKAYQDLPAFALSAAQASLWSKVCGLGRSGSAGAVAGASVFAVSNIFMGTVASATMGALIGSAVSGAAWTFWKEKNSIAGENEEVTRARYNAAIGNTLGEDLANLPAIQQLSVEIQKLFHFRQCLLNNTNNMRTEYLHQAGLDIQEPALTKEQIDLAIESFFTGAVMERFNQAFVSIYELQNMQLEEKGAANDLSKRVRAKLQQLFSADAEVAQEQRRFSELMMVGFVNVSVDFLVTKTEESGFWGHHRKSAAFASLILGLAIMGAAAGIAIALSTPLGWGLVLPALVALAVTFIPSGFLAYKCRKTLIKRSMTCSEDNIKGLQPTIELFTKEAKRMKDSIPKVKETTMQEAKDLGEMVTNDNDASALKIIVKKLFDIDITKMGMGSLDSWVRELDTRFHDSELIRVVLKDALQKCAEQSSKQTRVLQESFLTGHLQEGNKDYKPLTEYVNASKAFLGNPLNNPKTKEFRMKEKLKEQVMQIVFPAGIHAENHQSYAPRIDIPPVLKNFYTDTLGGSASDLDVVIAMANINQLLEVADDLQKKLKLYSRTNALPILAGTDLYRVKLGLAKERTGLSTPDPTVPLAINRDTIGAYLENSYQFMLSLGVRSAENFGDEYQFSIQYTLYKTLLIKQLAELVDPNKPDFDAAIRNQVLYFIQKKWHMNMDDIEEMFLQVQHQEFIAESNKGYSLIKVTVNPLEEAGLQNLKLSVQHHFPAYVMYEDKVYLALDGSTINEVFTVKPGPDAEATMGALNAIFTKVNGEEKGEPIANNQVIPNVGVRVLLRLEDLIKRPHDFSVAEAIRVNLAFGPSKATPENILEKVLPAECFKEAKTQAIKPIFLIKKDSVGDLDPTNASNQYPNTTAAYTKGTEAFITEIIKKIADLRDVNAAEIYLNSVKVEVTKITVKIATEATRMSNLEATRREVVLNATADLAQKRTAAAAAQAEADAPNSTQATRERASDLQLQRVAAERHLEAKTQELRDAPAEARDTTQSLEGALRALELHLANLDIYAAMIKIAKLEEPSAPKTTPAPAASSHSVFRRGFFGRCFARHPVKSTEAQLLSSKTEVLDALREALKSDEVGKTVTLSRNKVIRVKEPKGVRSRSLEDILGNDNQRIDFVDVPVLAANDAPFAADAFSATPREGLAY